jgi:hypothetical protein
VVITPYDTYTSFYYGQDQVARNYYSTGNGTVRIHASSPMSISTITISSTITATTISTITATNYGSEKTIIIGIGARLGVGFRIVVIAAAIFF